MTPISRERASAICLDSGKLLLVRLEDPDSGADFWVPPGGGIETGEDPLTAARRETREETGYEIEFLELVSHTATYPFRWAGRDYLTTTHFYAAVPLARGPMHGTETYLREIAWWPLTEGLKALNFHRDIFMSVNTVLELVRRRHPEILK